MPEKILFILPQPFFAIRGSSLRACSTVQALVDLGYEIDLLSLPFGDPLPIQGVTSHKAFRIPGIRSIPIGPSWTKAIYDFSLFTKAFYLAMKNPYAVIHGVEEGGIMALFLATLKRIPSIFDMHSHMSRQIRESGFLRSKILQRAFLTFEIFCTRHSSGIITVGDEITAWSRSVAPNVPVCSLEDLPLQSVEDQVDSSLVQSLLHEFHIEGKRVLLYTGNFEKYQGIDLLLQGFAKSVHHQAHALPADVHLLLVGGGDAVHPLVLAYKNLCRELHIEDRVTFTLERPIHEMGAFMKLADVLISPRSEGDNPPLKMYSYMASRKPMLASRIVSHTQILDDESAFLFDPDAESLGESIRFVFSDPARESKVLKAQKAYEVVQEKFNRKNFLKKLSDLYGRAQERTHISA